MATYPSIGLTHDIKPVSTRRLDISDSGVVRGVDLGEATVYQINLSHPIIDSTDRDTLLTFYDTNKTATNEITLAGSTYDCWFLSDYRVENVSASWFTLSVSMYGTKQ